MDESCHTYDSDIMTLSLSIVASVTLWMETCRQLMDPELHTVRCAHINNMHKLSVRQHTMQ